MPDQDKEKEKHKDPHKDQSKDQHKDQAKDQHRDHDKDQRREQEKEKEKPAASVATEAPAPAAPTPAPALKSASEVEEEASHYFFGEPLAGFDPAEITGTLVVIEGMDGSGRSTQITLLQEWLESEGFAVQTSGLRRSNLVGSDIDQLLAKNAVTRLTLALMYATDFFDQVEHRILPALRAGTVVLADRFIFTLIARGVVRGINRDYMSGLYAMALRPHLTFWLNVRPETAFGREFKKSQAISYWEAGRDMSLSHDLYWSFIRYQTMIKREFEVMAKRHNFIELDGEASVSKVNKELRHRIGEQLGIRTTKYTPSAALAHLWR
jgi:thymidylate kinase